MHVAVFLHLNVSTVVRVVQHNLVRDGLVDDELSQFNVRVVFGGHQAEVRLAVHVLTVEGLEHEGGLLEMADLLDLELLPGARSLVLTGFDEGGLVGTEPSV